MVEKIKTATGMVHRVQRIPSAVGLKGQVDANGAYWCWCNRHLPGEEVPAGTETTCSRCVALEK